MEALQPLITSRKGYCVRARNQLKIDAPLRRWQMEKRIRTASGDLPCGVHSQGGHPGYKHSSQRTCRQCVLRNSCSKVHVSFHRTARSTRRSYHNCLLHKKVGRSSVGSDTPSISKLGMLFGVIAAFQNHRYQSFLPTRMHPRVGVLSISQPCAKFHIPNSTSRTVVRTFMHQSGAFENESVTTARS
jgi:hypothetical protein